MQDDGDAEDDGDQDEMREDGDVEENRQDVRSRFVSSLSDLERDFLKDR